MLSAETINTLGSIAGILAVIGSISVYLLQKHKNRLHARRIERADDPDWIGVGRLHETAFDTEVADTCEDIKDWVELNWHAKKKKRGINLDELLLAAKSGNEVIGYFYGQYYHEDKYAFVSYLAKDHKLPDSEHASRIIVDRLFKILEPEKTGCKAVVAELEEVKFIERDGRRIDVGARRLLRLFGDSVRKASKKKAETLGAYRLCVDYHQPLLRPEDLSNKEELSKAQSLKQWLLYIPFSKSDFISDGGYEYVTKSAALGVMEFLLNRLYRDAFPNSKEYVDYLADELKRYEETLPEKIRVISDHTEAAKFRFEPAGAAS